MTTVDQIKAKFPNPRRSGEFVIEGSYCVGGAVVCYAEIEPEPPVFNCFPSEDGIESALCALNPKLAEPNAVGDASVGYIYAEEIIHENDMGHFDNAWNLVAEALAYKGPPAK